MAFSIRYSESAKKQLKKLDRQAQQRIVDYMDYQVATLDNPQSRGKALTGDLQGYWRYRIGEYRVVCQIQKDALIVLVLKIGHRKNIYE